MAKIAVIGSGVSGASSARLLQQNGHDVVVYEKSAVPGGLIKCTEEEGNLFHRVGGHVFNSKDPAVTNWFWANFDKDDEFLFAKRNAAIFLFEKFIGYPIENHIYQLDIAHIEMIVGELLDLRGDRSEDGETLNFFDFLHRNFGETLCREYFIPYNTKIWNRDLRDMPVSWLAGKLPMPKPDEIFTANIGRASEKDMVHAKFYYPRQGGSQFIIDRLLQGIDVRLDEAIDTIVDGQRPEINGVAYDAIVYTGDVRLLGSVLKSTEKVFEDLRDLKSNGTTTVLCSCEANPYSWVYIPDKDLKCHRMIVTGNFSPMNNSPDLPSGRVTCTVEFVGEVDEDTVARSIEALPFKPSVISSNFEPNSYVIQDLGTRERIAAARKRLGQSNIWLCGRFAEWEYFNMDAAIASAMNVVGEIDARTA